MWVIVKKAKEPFALWPGQGMQPWLTKNLKTNQHTVVHGFRTRIALRRVKAVKAKKRITWK